MHTVFLLPYTRFCQEISCFADWLLAMTDSNLTCTYFQVFQEIGDLIGEYLSSGTMDNRKPAILTASNTTKGISLATRKPKPKKYEPPKKLIPKKKREIPVM